MDIFDDDEDMFGNDAEILEIVDYGFPKRIYLRRNHFEDLDNLTFFQRFRLTKNTVLNILPLIEEKLEYPTDMYVKYYVNNKYVINY